MKKFTKNAFLGILAAATFAAGCTTELDEDALRSGAIQIAIEEVTNDEIYPTAGDEIDWKMLFVPSPGNITVNTFWDDPMAVFNVEIGIYDRFGIPIEVQRRDSGGATGEVKGFTPESGLHFIKVSAESGQSIYSINVRFEENYDGFVAPTTAPTFEAYLDFEAESAANAKASKSGGGAAGGGAAGDGAGGGGAGGGGAAAALPGGAVGGVALPTAAAGGAVLPTAAAGGIAAAGGQAGPTVVNTSSGGGYSSSEVKRLNSKTSAVSNEKAAIKPICADIKGRHKKIEAEIMSVTGKKKGAQIKLNVGHAQGVQEGAVGEIYIDGEILEGGRFKVEKILENSCTAVTNASAKDIKKASRFVVKSPE